MKLTILLISILLIGCNKEVLECENITINNTIETIEYINITVKEPCNLTYSDDKLELIRRIKFLEGQQDKWVINETECMPHNKTEEDLENCENKIDMYERDIDELEDELDNCTEEFCEYNSTWC